MHEVPNVLECTIAFLDEIEPSSSLAFSCRYKYPRLILICLYQLPRPNLYCILVHLNGFSFFQLSLIFRSGECLRVRATEQATLEKIIAKIKCRADYRPKVNARG
jgi:hypothetical protein